MISKKALKRIKKDLPRGSANLISQRLKIQGHVFTADYIRRNLDPNNKRKNPIIISEAISLRKELKELSISMEDDILKS